METIEDGPVRRMNVKEFNAKLEAADLKRRAGEKAVREQFQYEIDLIQINHYGPRWLVDGKCGGWDEETA